MAKNGRYDPFSGSSSGKNERLRLHNPRAGAGQSWGFLAGADLKFELQPEPI